MEKFLDNIPVNLLTRIYKGCCVTHEKNWYQNKTAADYTLWNILDGELALIINDKMHKISKGDVVLFYPGDSYIVASDTGCKFLFIYFKLEVQNGIDFLSNAQISGIIPSRYAGEICSEFSKNFMNMYTKAKYATLRLYSLFLNYFADLTDIIQQYDCPKFYPDAQKVSADIKTILEYINGHLSDDLQSKTLAAKFNMHENYFSRVFKKTVGIPPWQYVVAVRMRKAAELLQKNDMKILEISKLMGYSNQYSFSKAFKRYFDAAPTEYRRNTDGITAEKSRIK